jgi:fatty acid desaturase
VNQPPPDESLPALDLLGADLLTTSSYQRVLSLSRPFLGLLAYSRAAYAGLWLLTPVLVFLIFVAVVTVTHDIVHNSLGLSRRQTDWALFIFGAVLLESGHAYRASHLQHHRVFPGPDDPEGEPARVGFWRAIANGPVFLPKLWLWAWRRPVQTGRGWLLAEGVWAIGLPVLGILLLPRSPTLLVYCLLAIVGSWVYPLLTVYLPHHHHGETPLFQTHTLRGRVIPLVFLELTYHLEHHLYPQVPSHHLARLSKRLDPFFRRHGVQPRRVL